ncbi:hypothetical protein M2163_001438 [Streptomyces sp. SAI-135]|nr:hypothetical protein [Streptomyces sp. SAI-090]MDH6553864.1 hypothetical protein [Streptomyces sp. SAI-041]MDH6582096.1 hypothetical protein [Streptomyces sp. SAI-133]MDH6614330.1 hypothetical protein [Streptomyces sp. SAI-135]
MPGTLPVPGIVLSHRVSRSSQVPPWDARVLEDKAPPRAGAQGPHLHQRTQSGPTWPCRPAPREHLPCTLDHRADHPPVPDPVPDHHRGRRNDGDRPHTGVRPLGPALIRPAPTAPPPLAWEPHTTLRAGTCRGPEGHCRRFLPGPGHGLARHPPSHGMHHSAPLRPCPPATHARSPHARCPSGAGRAGLGRRPRAGPGGCGTALPAGEAAFAPAAERRLLPGNGSCLWAAATTAAFLPSVRPAGRRAVRPARPARPTGSCGPPGAARRRVDWSASSTRSSPPCGS